MLLRVSMASSTGFRGLASRDMVGSIAMAWALVGGVARRGDRACAS